MGGDVAFRRWLVALICCVAGTAASILYLDRPLASFFAAHVAHTTAGYWLNNALSSLVVIPVAALVFLLVCVRGRTGGRQLASWTRPVLICAWSITSALAVEFALKQLFGRLPGGGPHAGQFPSGTATISFAVAGTIWRIAPRMRLAAAGLAGFLCVAVVVTNGHWLSDVIAGAFLGLSIGWMTVHLHEWTPGGSQAPRRKPTNRCKDLRRKNADASAG